MSFASTNTIDFQYNTFERKLTVYFLGGGKHEYHDVPYDKYAALLSAKSKGQFFNDKIRDVYKSEKIY